MKYKFSFLIALCLIGCKTYFHSVTVVNQQEPIKDNKPLYFMQVYDSLPENAYYVGNFTISWDLGREMFLCLDIKTENEKYNLIYNDVKKAGANLVKFESTSQKERENDIKYKGKIYRVKEIEPIKYSYSEIKKMWDTRQLDSLEGIYYTHYFDRKDGENILLKIRYAVVKKSKGEYLLVYLDGYDKIINVSESIDLKNTWHDGDLAGTIRTTDKNNIFKIDYYKKNKALFKDLEMLNVDGNLRIPIKYSDVYLAKEFPRFVKPEIVLNSRTGLAIDSIRLLTSYKAYLAQKNSIFNVDYFYYGYEYEVNDSRYTAYVRGAEGESSSKHKLILEYFDFDEDIAIFKLSDSTKRLNPYIFSPTNKLNSNEINILYKNMANDLTLLENSKMAIVEKCRVDTIINDSLYILDNPATGKSGALVFDNYGDLIAFYTTNFLGRKYYYEPFYGKKMKLIKIESILKTLKQKSINYITKEANGSIDTQNKLINASKSIYTIELIRNE